MFCFMVTTILSQYTPSFYDKDALNAYSFVLSTIQDPALRDKQLELIDFLRLPRADICGELSNVSLKNRNQLTYQRRKLLSLMIFQTLIDI